MKTIASLWRTLAVAVWVLFVAQSVVGAGEGSTPNIVLILADDYG